MEKKVFNFLFPKYIFHFKTHVIIFTHENEQHSIPIENINPDQAEFIYIFHSFKAAIAHAISSFKRREIFKFMPNRHLQKLNI